ncbi:MAG: hypothetical protein HKM93_20980 [Desulfobacteraceae bacterium]|nr:hypothetical protein [Desulfobacteraceae bacterium]
MRYKADRELILKIDDKIWDDMSIRSELESLITNDTDMFYEILNRQFDEEFDIFGGQIIEYKENIEVDLDDQVQQFINHVISIREMTQEQALTLILDVVETFILNGKRMCL